ncbi:MAG: hypothetical protein LBH00_05380, partial [Planctomycetaceae bacterium]|nr:hypothetical protein [Planctomycetaceae bacterium]
LHRDDKIIIDDHFIRLSEQDGIYKTSIRIKNARYHYSYHVCGNTVFTVLPKNSANDMIAFPQI